MGLILNLPAELEATLSAEAAGLGMPLPEYALKLLATARSRQPVPFTGAQLVAYWNNEKLLGTRSEIDDAAGHARALRQQSQQRRS